MLPRAVISQLGLRRERMIRFRLGDERVARIATYRGEVVWHDGFKRVRVLESEEFYLASADLLAGSRVCIDMTPGGPVTIDEIPVP